MTIAAPISKTPNPLIFELISEEGNVTCLNIPKEYQSLAVALNRDMDASGVFIEFEAESLTFTGKPERDLLELLWVRKGITARCVLRIKYFDYITRSYKTYSDNFVLDFESYKKIKQIETVNATQLKTKNTSLREKLKDREKIKVDLSKLTSIEGFKIQDWAINNNILAIPQLNEYPTAKYRLDDNIDLVVPKNPLKAFTVPTNVIISDLEEAQLVSAFAGAQYLNEDNALIKQATIERIVSLRVNIIIEGLETVLPNTVNLFYRVTGQDQVLIPRTSNLKWENIEINNIIIPQGQSLIVYGLFLSSSSNYTSRIRFKPNNITITSSAIISPAKNIETFTIYKAIERCLQIILDKQYPLKSDFFGTTDDVKNANGEKYTSENQERFANIFNGLSARGLVLNDINNSVAISFNDLFKSLKSIWNVGYDIEIIDGEERVVIEDQNYFFSTKIGTDLTQRINKIELEYEALPDLVYSEFETGYKSFLYENRNGRGEYNTTNIRTSLIPLDNKYDNISEIRSDTAGIATLLRAPIVPDGINEASGTEDVDGDNDIFIIKSQRNGLNWKAELQENVQIVNDTSIYKTSSLNLFITPTRNLLRHSATIVCGLDKERNSFLRFQNSEKLQDLKTTNGVTEITENQDILINDLGDPRWMPARYFVEIPFYHADIISLISNKNKLVKLADDIQGWLVGKVKCNLITKNIELSILEKFEPPPPEPFFNVGNIILPINPTIGIESSINVKITNTGNLPDTQTVNVKWKRNDVVIRDVDFDDITLNYGQNIDIVDSYTFQSGDNIGNWTIEIITENDNRISDQFNVSILEPALFDITNVTIPILKEIGFVGVTTISISNTGNISATKNITIKWIREGLIVNSSIQSKFIAAKSNIQFNDSYTWKQIDDGNWTIIVSTEDDIFETDIFEVTEILI